MRRRRQHGSVLSGRTLPAPVVEGIVAHARACLPDEACGLIAVDRVGRMRMAYSLTNAEQAPDSFTIEPADHFGALTHAERHGWEIGAVFHSHPGGRAEPSATDLAQPHDPDWLHVIVGFTPEPEVRMWRFVAGRPIEIGAQTAANHPMAPRSAR